MGATMGQMHLVLSFPKTESRNCADWKQTLELLQFSSHLKGKPVAQGLIQPGFENLLGNLFQCLITLVTRKFFPFIQSEFLIKLSSNLHLLHLILCLCTPEKRLPLSLYSLS